MTNYPQNHGMNHNLSCKCIPCQVYAKQQKAKELKADEARKAKELQRKQYEKDLKADKAGEAKIIEKMTFSCDECRRRFKDGVRCCNKSCPHFGYAESGLKWQIIRDEEDELRACYEGN